MEKHKSCFCGATYECGELLEYSQENTEGNGKHYGIQCVICEYDCNGHESIDKAWEAWDKRATD